MIEVKVTTPEGRTTYHAEEDNSIMEFFQSQTIELHGATVSLDGITLTHAELNKSFTENYVDELCRLTVTVKSDNG